MLRISAIIVAAALLLAAPPAGAIHELPAINPTPGAELRQLNERLFEAAEKGRTHDVEALLERGASIEARPFRLLLGAGSA